MYYSSVYVILDMLLQSVMTLTILSDPFMYLAS